MAKNAKKEIRTLDVCKPEALLRIATLKKVEDGIKETGETPVNYCTLKDRVSEFISEVNAAYLLRGYNHALNQPDSVQAIIALHTVPSLNRKGQTPSVRVNLYDALGYIGSHKTAVSDQCDQLRTLIDKVVEVANATVKTAITTESMPTKDMKASLEALCQAIDPKWHGTSADARFLLFASFKAGRTLGTYQTLTTDSIGKYLQDVLYTKAKGLKFRAETKEDIEAMVAASDNL